MTYYLICKGSLEGTTSCHTHTLLMCYIVTFINLTSTTCFKLIRSSSGRYRKKSAKSTHHSVAMDKVSGSHMAMSIQVMNIILYSGIYTRVLNSELKKYINTSYTNKEPCEEEPIWMKMSASYRTQIFS